MLYRHQALQDAAAVIADGLCRVPGIDYAEPINPRELVVFMDTGARFALTVECQL